MKIIKILNYIFPLIIGALCSYMGSLTHIGKNNILQIIMIFTLSVIFSILLFYDAKTELDKLQKSYHNNYSNIITKFLILKNIVIQLFAIIIGAVCSSLGNWDKNQSGFSIKSNILIIFGIIYILFVIYSIYNDEKIDSNIKKYVSNIEMLNEIYENVQTSIVCINHAIIKELEKEIPYYNLRHMVKPGLTGWAQVMYPYAASLEDARRKLEYDLYYIKDHSLYLDMMIMFMTFKTVVFGKGR